MTTLTPKSTPARIIGWREYVALPEWGIARVEAKVDTGARTSALHVDRVAQLANGRVRFEVVLSRKNPDRRVPVEADLVRVTRVRSSTGHRQHRFVVATTVRIGTSRRRVELSLVRREKMLCRMLLGRTALSGFLVDVDRKHEHGRPAVRRKRGDRP